MNEAEPHEDRSRSSTIEYLSIDYNCVTCTMITMFPNSKYVVQSTRQILLYRLGIFCAILRQKLSDLWFPPFRELKGGRA